MSYENITTEIEDGIELITINRPNQLNALNKQTIHELSQELGRIREDSSVRALIITGSGEKAFVAGADIKEFAHFDQTKGKDLAAIGQELLFDKMEQMSIPTIAAVNGFALGGGLELAMACHIRVASDNAKLGLPEVSLGVIPGYGGTQRLSQLVGKGKALEMITTAGMIDANDALKWGLVNQVTDQEGLMDACKKIASKIKRNSPMAIAAAMRALLDGYKDGVDGFETEIEEFGKCFGTPEFKEGTGAFLEKRKASF